MFSYLAWTPSPFEIMAILGVALLLFGRRLPEVGRSLGKGIVEFKRGLSGVEEDLNRAGETPPPADTAKPQATLPDPKHPEAH